MSFSYCPNCGVRLPVADRQSAPQQCPACHQTQYHPASPCAGLLIVRDGRLLLVRRAINPFKGYWDIPGGFLEPGEVPYQAALREAREETGLEVRLDHLLGIYADQYDTIDGRRIDTLNVYFCATPVAGEAIAADDAASLQWFPMDQLPPVEQVAFEHSHRVLRDLRRWYRDGQSQGGDSGLLG